MKQKLFLFLVLIFIAVALVGLNAASYTQRQKTPDTEFNANRSTYNSGPTGTRALYNLLSESGRRVMRWEYSFDRLSNWRGQVPATIITIGPLKKEFEEPEIESLLRWVSNGGRLVVVDRAPQENLVTTTANWKMALKPSEDIFVFDVDPSDSGQMTLRTSAVKPVHPSRYTAGVYSVQLSRFASSITMEFLEPASTKDATDDLSTYGVYAPVVNISSEKGNSLVEAQFGSGSIVILSDPYPLANGGVSLVDNLRLALNLVESGEGMIAFDEYHHGYGSGGNRFFEFFAGTPVIAIFVQSLLIVGLVLISRSRRYGRPIPVAEPTRLTKLEYVGAMAELQRRTKAYDLAVENVFRDFWRRSARMFGLDAQTVSRRDLATRIAERSMLEANEIETLLYECEEVVAGAPTDQRTVRRLISKIREIENELGIRKAARR